MPGMYVVTSTAFVSRTRATLRNAEFGFFGVCVYTRMHTPRFSGQPANAGDFVLLMTSSRPMRTSCENVGTVFPLFGHTAAKLLRAPSRALAGRADKNARERSYLLKGLLRIRRYNQQETPYALQEVELISWYQFGEAYSALRGRRPIPAALPSHSVLRVPGPKIILPTQRFQNNRNRPTQVSNIPDKQKSIGKLTCSVKCLFPWGCENLCGKKGPLARGFTYLPSLPAWLARKQEPASTIPYKGSPGRSSVFAFPLQIVDKSGVVSVAGPEIPS